MATKCFSLVRGRVIRVTRLDACGAPVPGAKNQVVSKGIIQVAFTANNDEGNAISVPNANGDICIRDTPAPRFLNYTVEVQLCGVDPDLNMLLTGEDQVLDSDDNAVGFDKGSDVDLDDVRFALEMWSKVPGEQCTGGLPAFGYFLMPFIQGGVIGDFTWANDAVNFTISGAITLDGNDWGVGPYNVQLDDTDAAGPLVAAIGANKHLRLISTQVPPPTDVCGAQPLGVVATTATAGIPATLTPSFSYPPQTIAGLSAVTASPLTAWTAGQYVLLGDGSKAHWSSSAWVAGPA